MDKMGQWKYSPNQMASQIPSDLLDEIKVRWENTKQTVKDIYAQTLRQLVPTLTNVEVNKASKENENKMTLKFNTCLVLMKDIEYVVRNATNTWRNVFHLCKLSEYLVEIKDDDDSDKDEDNDEDSTQFVTMDYQELMEDDEEEKEEEATKEAKGDDEETDPVKIVVAVISTLPHSPAKFAT